MPSPVGHALAGITAGWLVDRPRTVVRTAIFGLAGAAADVDLLFGAHSGPTHGLGAAVMAGVVVVAVASAFRRKFDRGRIRFGVAVMAAYATHTLLDWLGTDTSAPIGIMALWPLARDYYESTLHVFMAISRRYWLPEFWSYNLRALARELAILVPILVAVYVLMRGRRPSPAA